MALTLLALSHIGARTPLMGWSSWNTYRVNISDSLILKQARALHSLRLDTLGYRYINIDDGFFGGRDADGNLLFHPRRFPHGLRPVADSIHALGLRAGIYSDAGRNTCGNFWDNDTIARGVGLLGHEEADCRLLFDSIGFDFIKIDFCGGDAFQNSEHLSLDPATRYRAIRAAAGSGVAINACRWNYPGTWVSEVAQSWRISPDISCSWQSVSEIIRQNLYLSAYADGHGFNDMDMLEVGRSLSPEEEHTHFAIWCIMSSPLLIGCDLTKLPPRTLSLISNPELIAVNQDSLGLQAYVADRHGAGYILVKDLGERNGLSRAVALYNPSDSPLTMTLNFSGIDLDGNVALRDLTARRDEGCFRNSATFTIEPRGTRLFKAVGEQRLERRLYEAETAFLTAYQEIYNPVFTGTAYYAADTLASGGVAVTNLGARPDNDLVWRHIYIPQGGKRTLTIHFSSPEKRQVFVSVNGGAGRLIDVDAGRSEATLECEMRAGDNTVRLYNDRHRAPDVDCLTTGL